MNPTHVEQAGPPRVSALIVTRNCAAQLERCLEALERSEGREQIEVVIVDNGSTDGTADVAARFPELQTLRLPKDFGRTKATNIGMRTAKGDLILFLPPHVELQPETIRTLADRLQESDAIGAVCPRIERWFRFPDGELSDPLPVPTDAAELSVDYPGQVPLLVRRDFVRAMNYFDERYGDYGSDLDLCWRLKSAGKTILALQNVPVEYGTPPTPPRDADHESDRLVGAATFIGKRAGSGAATKFRLGALFGALVRGQFSLLANLISGQKIDGTHA